MPVEVSRRNPVVDRLRNWAVLMRLEYVVLSVVAVVGALTARAGEIAWSTALILFAVNATIVAFGFIHNDLADEEIDGLGRTPEQRPLLSGLVTSREAWWLAAGCFAAGCGLHALTIGRLDSWIAMVAAFAFAALYNTLGKRLYGADLLYGASAACVAACGFLAVRQIGTESLWSSPLTLAFALATFSNNVFLNAILGGLKDVNFDRKAGARTFAILTGVREEDRLVIPPPFKLAAWSLRFAALAACWVPVATKVVQPAWPALVFLTLGSLAVFKTTVDVLRLNQWSRERIGKLARKLEFMSRVLFVFVLVGHASLLMCAIVLLTPFLYFVVSMLVHKKAFHNPSTF